MGERLSPEGKRRTTAVGLSLGLHATALLLLVTQAVHRFAPEESERRPVELELVPAPQTVVAQTPRDAASARGGLSNAESRAAQERRAAPARTSSSVRAQAASSQPPAAVTARVATAPPDGSAPDEWPRAGDLRGMLRAILGCSHQTFLRLDTAEHDRCDKVVAEAVRTAPTIDAVPSEKRRYYDAVVQAYAMRHTPAPVAIPSPLSDGRPTGPVSGERWSGPPGARMTAFGCAIPLTVPRGYKASTSGPPHSLKIGPLPCFVTPPSGFLTEESQVPSPVDLQRDQAP